MKIRGKHTIECDHEQVWDKLMDINYLCKVIPGGKKFTQGKNNEIKGAIKLHVGPVKGKLGVTLTQVKIVKPHKFTLQVFAKGAGISLKGNVNFWLEQNKECESELSYAGFLSIKGIPGIFHGGVTGTIKKKLKNAIFRLCKSIEKSCTHAENTAPPKADVEQLNGDIHESQYDKNVAAIIDKAHKQFEAELADLVARTSAQLKADLTELVSTKQTLSHEENGNAH